MPLHLFFITSTTTLPTKHHPRSRVHPFYTRPPHASISPPKRHAALLTPPNVAQTARAVMSAVQLSTFLTTSLILPLYTQEILPNLPASFPIIRALGLANLSTTITLHHHRSLARPCRLANAISFLTTAALYLTSPLKPEYINIPFTFTLILIAITNAMSFTHLPRSRTNTVWRSAPLAKFAAAAAALVTAFLTAGLLLRVYLLQIALNLAVAAAVALSGSRMSQFLSAADAFALFGVAACLVSGGAFISAVFVFVAALYSGLDAVSGTDA